MTGIIDTVLEKFNLDYEDLNASERETLNKWLEQLSSRKLSIEDVKEYLKQMIFAVQNELTDVKHGRNKDMFLKARLKNYMLLDAFLDGPEKAKKRLEAHLSQITKKNT